MQQLQLEPRIIMTGSELPDMDFDLYDPKGNLLNLDATLYTVDVRAVNKYGNRMGTPTNSVVQRSISPNLTLKFTAGSNMTNYGPGEYLVLITVSSLAASSTSSTYSWLMPLIIRPTI